MSRVYNVPEPRPAFRLRPRADDEVVKPGIYDQGSGPRLSWRDADTLIALLDRVKVSSQPNPVELAMLRAKLERGRP